MTNAIIDPTDIDILAAHTAQLDVKLLSDKARLPTAGSAHAAGLDLYAAEQKTIPARGKALVNLQISVAVPLGHYGRVAPRSGLASKHGIQTGAGVIDSDYRGTVFVLLFNHTDVDFEVNEGDRIAQLILERISHARVNQVETLDDTVRGAGGFGSTGGFGVKRARVEEAVAAVAAVAEDAAPVDKA